MAEHLAVEQKTRSTVSTWAAGMRCGLVRGLETTFQTWPGQALGRRWLQDQWQGALRCLPLLCPCPPVSS